MVKNYFFYSIAFLFVFTSSTEGVNLLRTISPKISASLSLSASNCAKDPTLGVKALGVDSLNPNCLKVTQQSLKNEIKVNPNFASIVSRWNKEIKSDYIKLIAMRLENPKTAPTSLTIVGQNFLDAVANLRTRIQQSTDLETGISINASNCAQNLQLALKAALSTGSNPNCIKAAMKQMDPNQTNPNREYIYLFNLFTEDEKDLMRRLFAARSGNLEHDLNNIITEIKSRNLLNSPIFKLYTIIRTSNRFTCGYGGLDDIRSLLKPAYNINCWYAIQKNKDKITQKLKEQFGQKVVTDFTNLLHARLSLKTDPTGAEITPHLWETTIMPLLELIGVSVPKPAAKAPMPASEPVSPSKRSGIISGQSMGVQSGKSTLVAPTPNRSSTQILPLVTGEGRDEPVDIEEPKSLAIQSIARKGTPLYPSLSFRQVVQEITPALPPLPTLPRAMTTMVVQKTQTLQNESSVEKVEALVKPDGTLNIESAEDPEVSRIAGWTQALITSLMKKVEELQAHGPSEVRRLFIKDKKWRKEHLGVAAQLLEEIQAAKARSRTKDQLTVILTFVKNTLTTLNQLEGPIAQENFVAGNEGRKAITGGSISPLSMDTIPVAITPKKTGGTTGVSKGTQQTRIPNIPSASVVPGAGSGEGQEETILSPDEQFEEDVKALIKDTATEADFHNKTLVFTNIEQLTSRRNMLSARLKTLKVTSQKQMQLEMMLHEVHLNLITAHARLWARVEASKEETKGKTVESQAFLDLSKDITSLLQSAKTSDPRVAGDFIKLEDLYRHLHTYAEFKTDKTQFKLLEDELDSIRTMLNNKKGKDIWSRIRFERKLDSLYSDASDLKEGSAGEITLEKISSLEQRKNSLESTLKSEGLVNAPEKQDWEITIEVIEDELKEAKSKLTV